MRPLGTAPELERRRIHAVELMNRGESPAVIARVVASGHYFSVNPAMVSSARGRSVVERVPPERVLTETDGPHVRVGERPAKPSDVRLIVDYLSDAWVLRAAEVESKIMANFRRVIEPIRADA